jgi:prevent-host-death family protein
MGAVYSVYEAKARFSEVIRKVRAGQRIRIAYRGQEIAEIRPVESPERDLEKRLARLEEQGVLSGPRERGRKLRPLARRRGALRRCLEERE